MSASISFFARSLRTLATSAPRFWRSAGTLLGAVRPQVTVSRPRFYQYGWYYHFKHAGLIGPRAETLITAASLGTKKERASFSGAVEDVMRQTSSAAKWRTDFWPCGSDPCLQVADYCAWAIQRKWERGDTRSYDLISDRVTYEYELWARGTKLHY